MNVSDIMTLNPVTIGPQKTLTAALHQMQKIKCHHLPVVSKNNHLIGIISDYDCHLALSNIDTKDQADLRVNMKMTPAPIIVAPDAPVETAAHLMLTNNIRCLPVMLDETLIGIITTSDVLIAFIHHLKKKLSSS